MSFQDFDECFVRVGEERYTVGDHDFAGSFEVRKRELRENTWLLRKSETQNTREVSISYKRIKKTLENLRNAFKILKKAVKKTCS